MTNRPTQDSEQLSLDVATRRQGNDVLEFEHLTLQLAGRTLINDLTLNMTRGQRIGIIGRNGVGKTTLLRTVLGEVQPTAGRVRLGKNTRVAYLDQKRAVLNEDESIAENVAAKRDRVEFGEQQLTIYSYLERFRFRGSEIHKPVAMLSGGERARVALAKLLLSETNLLLLDEPTNDLDVTTLSALEEMLLQFSGSALVVTHDRYFLNRVATDLLVFEEGQRLLHYVGNYDTYKALRKNAGPQPGASGAPTSSKRHAQQNGHNSKKPSKLGYLESKELEALMPRIERLETEVSNLQAQLAEPATYRDDPDMVARLQAELDEKQAELEATIGRWEELETKREELSAQTSSDPSSGQ